MLTDLSIPAEQTEEALETFAGILQNMDLKRVLAVLLLLAACIRGRVEEDYPHRRLLVTVEEFGEEYDSIYQCMDRARQLLPAHLEVVFEFGGPDWTQWEAAAGTWSAFDAADLTWQQRDRAENL